MRIVQGTCEIALSKEDVTAAMRLWVRSVTMAGIDDFQIESVTLHPGNKYVLRMVIKPPEAAKRIKASADEKAALREQIETAKTATS